MSEKGFAFNLIQPALDALGKSPVELQVADADCLLAQRHPHLSTDRPALVGLAEGGICASLQARLLQAYPEAHQVVIVEGLAQGHPSSRTVALAELERAVIEMPPAFLYLPPLPCPGAVETFQELVAHLRAPDGCPWDRRQTHRSLRQGFQEEAHEVLDALDRGDVESLKEELGDVLLHLLLQVQIAVEEGEFRLCDVICHAHSKIVRRHPHVFAGLQVNGVREVLVNWEDLKRREKQANDRAASVLDGISPSMPALARAQSIQRRVERAGVISTSVEELAACAVGHLDALRGSQEHEAQERELGELLFALANLARLLGLDAESALREKNSRFERDFRAAEHAGDASS